MSNKHPAYPWAVLSAMGMIVLVAGTRAILDSRQKALKLTANALYGFTGAMASPLQSVALADGCLALGSQVNAPPPPPPSPPLSPPSPSSPLTLASLLPAPSSSEYFL